MRMKAQRAKTRGLGSRQPAHWGMPRKNYLKDIELHADRVCEGLRPWRKNHTFAQRELVVRRYIGLGEDR